MLHQAGGQYGHECPQVPSHEQHHFVPRRLMNAVGHLQHMLLLPAPGEVAGRQVLGKGRVEESVEFLAVLVDSALQQEASVFLNGAEELCTATSRLAGIRSQDLAYLLLKERAKLVFGDESV